MRSEFLFEMTGVGIDGIDSKNESLSWLLQSILTFKDASLSQNNLNICVHENWWCVGVADKGTYIRRPRSFIQIGYTCNMFWSLNEKKAAATFNDISFKKGDFLFLYFKTEVEKNIAPRKLKHTLNLSVCKKFLAPSFIAL